MKKALGILILALVCAYSPGFAEDLKELSASQWESMDHMDKSEYMLRLVDALQMKGVPLPKSTDEYIDIVDTALEQNPEFIAQNLYEIFENTVSQSDASAKEAIKRIKDLPLETAAVIT